MSTDQVTAEAMALREDDGVALTCALLDSAQSQDYDDLDPEFRGELRRRCEELDSGKVVGRSREEVRASVMRKLGCD